MCWHRNSKLDLPVSGRESYLYWLRRFPITCFVSVSERSPIITTASFISATLHVCKSHWMAYSAHRPPMTPIPIPDGMRTILSKGQSEYLPVFTGLPLRSGYIHGIEVRHSHIAYTIFLWRSLSIIAPLHSRYPIRDPLRSCWNSLKRVN